VLKGTRPDNAAKAREIAESLRNWVSKEHRPDRQARRDPLRRQPAQDAVRKIMRRLLRAIAKGEDITQDVSTLENPAILEQLKNAVS